MTLVVFTRQRFRKFGEREKGRFWEVWGKGKRKESEDSFSGRISSTV